MPGVREHIVGSALVGAGYGAAGWAMGGLPAATCGLAAGLCTAAGMLPDLDGGPGDSLRERVSVAAALVPIMLVPRFQQLGLPIEGMVLAAAGVYFTIRYGLEWLLGAYTSHRGMLHSLPAAAIAGQLAFLACGGEESLHRYFVAGAVVLGFITHLVLDEIWAVRNGWFGPKAKKAFGSAMKFHGPVLWANIVTYVLAVALGAIAAGDAAWTERRDGVRQQMQQAVRPYPQQYPQWQFRR